MVMNVNKKAVVVCNSLALMVIAAMNVLLPYANRFYHVNKKGILLSLVVILSSTQPRLTMANSECGCIITMLTYFCQICCLNSTRYKQTCTRTHPLHGMSDTLNNIYMSLLQVYY